MTSKKTPKNYTIRAGKTAKTILKDNGFTQDQFNIIAAAAGGPKWLVLYGIDAFLFGNFFKNRSKDDDLHLVGSSAGAWRMICAASPKPMEVLEVYCKEYIEQSYDKDPPIEDITATVRGIIATFIDHKEPQILAPKGRPLYIFTSATPADYQTHLKSNLTKSFIKNMLSRKAIFSDFQRHIFHSTEGDTDIFSIDPFYDITQFHELTPRTLPGAAAGTGSIPLVINPPRDVAGKDLLHWDGGLTDYHVAMPFKTDKLVLYPHFSSKIKMGWFDKHLPYRNPPSAYFDRTVTIHPSADFIQSLPDQKIPDRTDFTTYIDDNPKRIAQWYEVVRRSEELAEELQQDIESGTILDLL